jgi:DnaJ-class molecular chaperone
MVSKEVKQQHPPCPACGGTGQLNFFKGESRFLLSVEECPACCGFGYMQDSVEENEVEEGTKKKLKEKKSRSERKG